MGLLKTGKLRAEKEDMKKKSTDMVLSDGEGDSESESPSFSNSEDTVSDEPPQKERRMKRKNDRGVVGSNAPFNPTQQSASVEGLPGSENETLAALADALKTIRNTRKRKKQQTEDISTKKGVSKELRVVKRGKTCAGLPLKLTTGRIEQGCLTRLILLVLEGGRLLKDLPLLHLNHLNHPNPEQ
ncbi:hypothetical protein PIB30_102621, partial [Stylosanthes scabra]|nr:hypothetical protein [Stylosanthes scabra]